MLTMKLDGSAWRPFLLGAVAMVGVALLWRGLSAPPPAYGQIPDSGEQRLVMIQELRKSNQQLAEMTGLLREIRDLQKKAGPAEKPATPGAR